MNEGLMVIGPDGVIITVNREFERMTGYGSDDVVGRPCTALNCDACEKSIQQNRPGWCKLFERSRDHKVRCVVMKADSGGLNDVRIPLDRLLKKTLGSAGNAIKDKHFQFSAQNAVRKEAAGDFIVCIDHFPAQARIFQHFTGL